MELVEGLKHNNGPLSIHVKLLESTLANLRSKDRAKTVAECISEIEVMQTSLEQMKTLLKGLPSLSRDLTVEEPEFLPIFSLRPETSNWTITATVATKGDIKKWNTSRTTGQLFQLTLKDDSDSIVCTIFDDAVDKFWRIFQVGNVCEMCTASIVPHGTSSSPPPTLL
eukprot:TRINITY_DN2960_c0_g1_i1.p1 TRINITY_DN2960_c0_g1~~TRINITY_DN2960_c0_g1_i1.p1  ORF type:complete len:168 (-),score=21.17 TRINITY_DN2960_c0_g1_i1:42-545(-)